MPSCPGARAFPRSPRSLRKKDFLGRAYRCCHNEPMDSTEAYIPSAQPSLPGGALPPAPRPLGPALAPEEDPFAQAGAASRARSSLRKRISGALAAVVAVVAKFFAAIKG